MAKGESTAQYRVGLDHHVRELLVSALDWSSAHLNFDAAFERIPQNSRHVQVSAVPYTAWQLLEHMRLTQRDILEFCRNPAYEEPRWPDEYWPDAAPPDSAAWERSMLGFKSDLAQFKALIADPTLDLSATIPHGDGQTYFREAVLVVDHNACHLGQLVLLGRLLERSVHDRGGS